MLPSETFTEVVAFLRLFDLSALAVTNTLFSTLAVKASSSIRWEEFPGLEFLITDGCIAIGKLIGTDPAKTQARSYQDLIFLLFPDQTTMVEFIAAAFRNCIFDDLEISCGNKHFLDAIHRAADSVIVKGALSQPASLSPDDSLGLVRTFRKAKALRLRAEVNEDEVTELANFYRGSGVQELQYYRSSDAYPTPTIVALD